MTAIELANELDKSREEPYTSEHLVGKAASMLRQQQAKLDALKKELESCKVIVALSNIAWERKHGKD
jgi:hypothetical protein